MYVLVYYFLLSLLPPFCVAKILEQNLKKLDISFHITLLLQTSVLSLERHCKTVS